MKKLLFLLLLTAGCRTGYYPAAQQASRPVIDASVPTDSNMARFLAPYRQRLDQTMNDVLAQSAVALDKKGPESPLTDLLADAMLRQGRIRYGKPIDVAHLNFGGIRSGLPQGPIRVGNIYEIMPFDNQMTVLTLNGNLLMQMLNHFAREEALVVSGVKVRLTNGKVTAATLTDGRTVEPGQSYTVAVSDYVANGGSGASFLSGAAQREDTGINLRDLFLEYFRQLGQSGQPFNPTTDGRITIE